MTNTVDQIITITDIAVKKFQELLFDANKKDSYLKIAIVLDGTQMQYSMDIKDELIEGDKVYTFNELKMVINEEDELLLKGLEIDYVQDEFGSEFTLHNPNMMEIYDDEDGGCCGGGCCCGH
ncbi:iron-sulfur cluster assembly accessory protein [Gemella bergeri ATCC 700627]|uniref:Iron-sulfur cluster assembly accessory protein n=1 Tax=Gemella bergeri ATCC 700627 TaxID=1321820 RepID=U2S0I1_9BACL|nr:iron-sulfur cluster assembly accessory protein [Gemella bergeri]ERK56342.1 iron-sulfur cluster assembly accessory protein [Gemella bergeri ATCC 700627]